jgi:2-polyprenyl-3-methyl-5-hydroxy-6-metoxy-1,4-benzoquinol methylase
MVMDKCLILRNVLICLRCQGELQEEPERYVCQACGETYPVVAGVPRFLTDLSRGEQQVRRSFNLEHARYTDSCHLHFTPRLVQPWLEDIQLPAEYFKGKLVLDAGCGSGRWTYAMALLGARVIAVDFTDSGVTITHQATHAMENVAVVQANLFGLPFQPGTFDFVVSWGVLHHTPDTRAAFERIAPLVKRGGHLYVMVYEKHNPVKFFFTNLIRWILRKLPEDRRYQACKLFIIRNRRLCSLLGHLMICAYQPKTADPLALSTMQLGLYDAYAPVFNHLHTREEVSRWFRDSRFGQITLTKPVRYTTKTDVFRFGECGGSVNMRGVRT